MVRLIVLAALAVPSALATTSAHAAPRRLCADLDVLDFMARAVQANDPYARIDPRGIAELPAAYDSPVKTCTATTVCVLYHQPPYPGPVPTRGVTRYEVRPAGDGYVVTPLP